MENIEPAESSLKVTEKETPERKVFEVEEFIEAFRNLPYLWNTSLSCYKDRTVKQNA